MVEATGFPHLSNKFSVLGVPRTVINEATFVESAAPEAMLMAKLPIGKREPDRPLASVCAQAR
jgi:hypothetical protein